VRTGLITLLGLGLLLTGLSQAAGNPDCANLLSTSEMRVVAGTEGSPVELEAPGYLFPGCDEPGDALEVTIDWSDGATSPARVEPDPADSRRYTIHGEHTYQRPAPFRIDIAIRNTRTGVVSHDRHYTAEIAARPFTLRATGRLTGTVARATFAGRRWPGDLRATIESAGGRRSRAVVTGSGRRLAVRAPQGSRLGRSAAIRVRDLPGRRSARVRIR
jgi:hypothetical protein